MSSKSVFEILSILALLATGSTLGQTSHGETAEPEAQLKPRNFNPHPFETVNVAESRPIVVTSSKNDVSLADDDALQDINVASSSSHLFRRQSSAVFNQGPIQFPRNDDAVRPAVAQQSRFYLNNQRSPAPTQAPAINRDDNYDDDYDRGDSSSLSKKHYAFSYVVRDQHSGDDFSHNQQQQKDGGVSGSYKVQLPDGRTQVVKYTADHDGYKADVTYIENAVADDDTPRSHVYQVAPTASRPKYYPLRPSLTQLSLQRLSGGYDLPKPEGHLRKYSIPSSPLSASTPRPFALNASPAPASAYVAHQPPHKLQHGHSNYVDLQNVEIETYNTAPHHFTQQQLQHNAQLVRPGQIVFPTSPTHYNDIHVLPSPRSYPSYATTAPFNGGNNVSHKSTSVVAPSVSYAAFYHPANVIRPSATNASPSSANIYYLASKYSSQNYNQPQLQQPLPRQQFYVATVPIPNSNHHARRSADHSSVSKSDQSGSRLAIRPDQALYYKEKK